MPELELSRQDPLEACCCFIFPWFKLFCGIKKIKTSPTSNFAIKRSKLRQCSAVGGAYLFIFLWYLQHHWHRRDWSFIRSASDDAGCLQDMFRHHIHGCRCACFFILHIKKRILYIFSKIKSSIDSFCCNIAWTHLYTLHTRALSELIPCFDFRGP